MERQIDVMIIGQGPAGLSAAIYAVRSGASVVLAGRDGGSLARAEKIENYFGFAEPVSGAELLARGLAQARRLGVEILQAEVTGISFLADFTVETTVDVFHAASVILATGMPRKKAAIAGLSDFEGRGVSYCATCDGFFYRGKKVAVVGNGGYALREASELQHAAREVAIFTNGRPFEPAQDPGIRVDLRKILHVEGDDFKIRRLVLESSGASPEESVEIDGVFIAEGTASALDLAMNLGLDNDGKAVRVNCLQQTNVPGFYAIGDCTGGIMQVSVAVGEGAKAGIAAGKYVRKLKGGEDPAADWSK